MTGASDNTVGVNIKREMVSPTNDEDGSFF